VNKNSRTPLKINLRESGGVRAVTLKTVNRARHSNQIADLLIKHTKTYRETQRLNFTKHVFHRWGRAKSRVRVLTHVIFVWFRVVNYESKLLSAMCQVELSSKKEDNFDPEQGVFLVPARGNPNVSWMGLSFLDMFLISVSVLRLRTANQ
jgi:hypothetical protein